MSGTGVFVMTLEIYCACVSTLMSFIDWYYKILIGIIKWCCMLSILSILV